VALNMMMRAAEVQAAGGGSGGGIMLVGLGAVAIQGTLSAVGGNGGTPGAGNTAAAACIGANTGGAAGGGGRIKIFTNPCVAGNVITPTTFGNSRNSRKWQRFGRCSRHLYNNSATAGLGYVVLTSGTVSGSQTICQNTDLTTFSSTAATGGIGTESYTWYATCN